MTYSSLLWPIICALQQATCFVGLNNWIPAQPSQTTFLTRSYAPLVHQLARINKHEITVLATNNVSELNATLQAQGASIRLTESLDTYTFGIVANMYFRTQWKKVGTLTSVEHHLTHIAYPAVHRDSDFDVFLTAMHPYPLICMRTHAGDTVWLTCADCPRFDSDLQNYVGMLRTSTKILDYSYDACSFPCVRYEQECSPAWLSGLRLGQWRLHQAFMYTQFILDERGIYASDTSATTPSNYSYQIKKTACIDQPFFIWVERAGMHEPLFAGYMPEQFWKK